MTFGAFANKAVVSAAMLKTKSDIAATVEGWHNGGRTDAELIAELRTLAARLADQRKQFDELKA